jgi:hypothetical protein
MSFRQCRTFQHCPSGLHHKRAGSPDRPAATNLRSVPGSQQLRTGRSHPVASHPVSRRRSYLQIQAGERLPEEDSHLSDQTNLQTHPLVASPPRLQATSSTREDASTLARDKTLYKYSTFRITLDYTKEITMNPKMSAAHRFDKRLYLLYLPLCLATGGCSPTSNSTHDPQPVFKVESPAGVNYVRFSPTSDNCLIVAETQIQVVDRSSGKTKSLSELLPFSLTNGFRFADFLTEDELIVAGNSSSVQLLGANRFESIREIGRFAENPHFAYLTVDKADLVTVADKNILRRINCETSQKKWNTKTKFDDIFSVHSCSQDWIALGEHASDCGRACLYSFSTGIQSDLVIEHEDRVRGIAFSRDNRLIATTSESGTLKIHELETGEQKWETVSDSHGAFGVDFHPDGDRIAVGCMRGVKIWSISQRKLLAAWNAHSWFVRTVQFSSDGKQLLSGSADKTTALWNLSNLDGVLRYRP